MKCPLLTTISPDKAKPLSLYEVDCFEDDCAWYHKAMRRCRIASIDQDLWTIAENMALIIERLPPKKEI